MICGKNINFAKNTWSDARITHVMEVDKYHRFFKFANNNTDDLFAISSPQSQNLYRCSANLMQGTEISVLIPKVGGH